MQALVCTRSACRGRLATLQPGDQFTHDVLARAIDPGVWSSSGKSDGEQDLIRTRYRVRTNSGTSPLNARGSVGVAGQLPIEHAHHRLEVEAFAFAG